MEGFPGVYAKITTYYDWIQSIIKDEAKYENMWNF